MQSKLLSPSLIISPIIFGLAGASCRWMIQSGIETRFQILCFWIFIASVEFGGNRKNKPNWLRFILTIFATTAAIIAMKLYLEGIPPKVSLFLKDTGVV